MSKKWMRIAGAAMYVSLLGTVSVAAQDQTTPAQQQDAPMAPHDGHGPGGRGPGGHGPERQMEMLTKELNLSADQQTQVKGIEMDSRKQMMALREDTSTPQEQKRDKMMAIRTASQAKVRAVLTDDQKTKFDAMEARMHERMQNREAGGPNGGPPPPSQQ